ncbi:MAG: hypothetical protein LW719_12665 [Comamonadaceae bacterium]|nr:hypothetical protein [Comamonadaceae bacterium]
MELKRILARDTRSAMEQAIKTYGPDVLVISNHQVGGQTELVVAIEVPISAVMEPVIQPAIESTAADPVAHPGRDRDPLGPLAPAASHDDPPAANFRQSLQAASQPQTRSALPDQVKTAADAPAARSASSEQDARDYLRSREIVEMVRDEISALRREFRMRQQTADWQSGLSVSPAAAPLVQALQEASIPGALRALLIEGASQASDARQGLQALRAQLLHHLKRPAGSLPIEGLHLLAGPSGAGKTLMTARLARLGAQAGCDQVAIISYQDVRAGAWSQTQMLAAQLGVDAFRATDAQSLRLLVNELSTRKLVLIDTAGIQMGEHVGQALAQASDCQCHAVLPVDASSATLDRVLGQGVPFKSLLLTKTDEASSAWPLLQFLSDNPMEISGASHGARAADLTPDFNIEQLVDLALAPLAAAIDMPLSHGVEPSVASALPSSAMDAPAGALSATMASIATLPSVPMFRSTADVLGAPAAARRGKRVNTAAEAKTQAQIEIPVTVKPARKASADKAKPAVAAEPVKPAARSRKPSSAAVAKVAATPVSRRKAASAAAHV